MTKVQVTPELMSITIDTNDFPVVNLNATLEELETQHPTGRCYINPNCV